jgi:hypothetical protein
VEWIVGTIGKLAAKDWDALSFDMSPGKTALQVRGGHVGGILLAGRKIFPASEKWARRVLRWSEEFSGAFPWHRLS